MKIYSGGRAPNPRRVSIFLAEKGIEIDVIDLDINKLEQREHDFVAKNPMRTVPVLELDDGTIIAESVAICRYFEEIHPEPALMGTTAVEKAIIEMWQRRIELKFMMPVAFSFRHLHPGAKHLEAVQLAEWGRLNQPAAARMMEFLDGELAGREFMAGDSFSIADITAIVAYQFLKPARIEVDRRLVHLRRWADAMLERPSVQW